LNISTSSVFAANFIQSSPFPARRERRGLNEIGRKHG
jgi:hypothetical protein